MQSKAARSCTMIAMGILEPIALELGEYMAGEREAVTAPVWQTLPVDLRAKIDAERAKRALTVVVRGNEK
jgi:hypothetical protein